MKNEPAFPSMTKQSIQSARQQGVSHPEETYVPGMTLRDYFAAKAMQSYVDSQELAGANEITVAAWSYKMADAMLKAREENDTSKS